MIEDNPAAGTVGKLFTKCTVRFKTGEILLVTACALLIADLSQLRKSAFVFSVAALTLHIPVRINQIVGCIVRAIKIVAAYAALSQVLMA